VYSYCTVLYLKYKVRIAGRVINSLYFHLTTWIKVLCMFFISVVQGTSKYYCSDLSQLITPRHCSKLVRSSQLKLHSFRCIDISEQFSPFPRGRLKSSTPSQSSWIRRLGRPGEGAFKKVSQTNIKVLHASSAPSRLEGGLTPSLEAHLLTSSAMSQRSIILSTCLFHHSNTSLPPRLLCINKH
jgi:hypothetical protein